MRLLLIVAITVTLASAAQAARGQDDLQRQRQEILSSILTTDRAELVARQRMLRIEGQETARVSEARQDGFKFTPDAVDSCIAVLQRTAKDNALLSAYQTLAQQYGGTADAYKALPKAIGATVLSDGAVVSVGNAKGMPINPQLASDAGFTVAYTYGAAAKAFVSTWPQ